jgi:hypothetical protein
VILRILPVLLGYKTGDSSGSDPPHGQDGEEGVPVLTKVLPSPLPPLPAEASLQAQGHSALPKQAVIQVERMAPMKKGAATPPAAKVGGSKTGAGTLAKAKVGQASIM